MFKREIRLMVITAAMAIAAIILVTGTSYAKDIMIEKEITRIFDRTDKNGDAYRILMVKIPKTMNGISYFAPLPVMAFSDTIDMTSLITEGQTVKLIISMGQYMGRDTATLRAVVE
jgi:hypothetical protein